MGFPRYSTADFIAAQLVARACLLLNCPPQDLRISSHPADGPVTRRWHKGAWRV